MENIKKLFRNKYITYGLLILVGLILGRILFNAPKAHEGHQHEHTEEATVWTCSMHPQIRQDKPGKCPLCAMDLIPLVSSGGSAEIDPEAIQLSEEAIALAGIQTSRVSRQQAEKALYLYGAIAADERSSRSQVAHIGGRIEKLFVSFTGERIKEGQVLALIYSPELLRAQQELLEAVKREAEFPELAEAARAKLSLWKLDKSQIEAIESAGKANPYIEIRADFNGIVTGKHVNQGDYVDKGTPLFTVSDLSSVWALFDAYQGDLPFLKNGDIVEFQTQALPGKTFSGKISFIEPVVDGNTRSSKVRVDVSNQGGELKPGMYLNGTVRAKMQNSEGHIIVPASAVLWTGKRSIVYVKQQETETPAFMLREIELGPSLGDAWVVLSGISEGEEIATKGVFSIDASAQLAGKRSMMNVNIPEAHAGHSAYDGHAAHSDVHSGHAATSEHTSSSVTHHDHKDHDGEHTSHHNASHSDPKNRTNTSDPRQDNQHLVLKVSGNCGMCKENIETAASGVDGVKSAVWDMDTKELHLQLDVQKTGLEQVSRAIADVGYETELHPADMDAYNALPACCQYKSN